MKKFIIGLFLGAISLIVAIYYYSDKNRHAERAREDLKGAATQTRQLVEEKLGASNLTTDNIKDELARTGQVVRQKAHDAGAALQDAATDARITASIKTKLVRDASLSSLSISVSTAQGTVTLSGTTSSVENIRQAMQLALDTDGVQKVISTIQLKK